MTKGQRKAAKLLVGLLCLVWIAGSGVAMFATLGEDEVQTHSSDTVKDRLRDCEGTFKQRYECKEAIVIQTHRKTFYTLSERLAIVVLPPSLLAIAFSMALKRIPVERPHHRHEHAAVDWKTKAEMHIHHPHHPAAMGDDHPSGQS
ncbi:MAG: hypothetical protein ACM33T_14660 [Solirubrobacterales bacterium]